MVYGGFDSHHSHSDKSEERGTNMKIKDIKKGDYFTLKDIPEPKDSQVYIRGEYCRENKKYSCYKFNDVNDERFFSGDKEVFTNMTF